MFKLHQSISDLQGKVMWLWHPCAINAIHFFCKTDLFQLDFWRLWRGWWWNNRNRRGHQAGWFHSQDQLILTFLNIETNTAKKCKVQLPKCPPQTCPGDWTLHNGRSGSWTGGGSCLCQGYYWSGNRNISKDIVGQRSQIFSRALLVREMFKWSKVSYFGACQEVMIR